MMVDLKPSSSAGANRLVTSVSDAGQILASVSEAIVAVGADDRVTFANPAAAELFNRDVSAMPGIALDRLFVLADGAPAPVKAQLVTGPFHSDYEAWLQRTDGSTFEATYDQLTGLPNQTLFNDRLNRLVLEARRAKSNIGLMSIDLDGFKAINDNLGHDAGDLLLQGAAERLLKCVCEADTVARLGGANSR